MKQMYLSILLSFLAIAMPKSAFANSKFYGNDFSKTGVVSSNAIKSGTVTFDAETYTLTLDNVVAEGSNSAIFIDSPSMTIKLIGENVLRSTNSGGIYIANSQSTLITSVKDGKIVATTTTEGATCHISYAFTGVDSRNATTEISIPTIVLKVSAHATAPGKNSSPTVNATFNFSLGQKGDINDDGELSVEDVTKLVNLLIKK